MPDRSLLAHLGPNFCGRGKRQSMFNVHFVPCFTPSDCSSFGVLSTFADLVGSARNGKDRFVQTYATRLESDPQRNEPVLKDSC